MALSAEDLVALSSLFDAAEAVDTAERPAWLAALPAPQRHLVPALQRMLDGATSDGARWTLPRFAPEGPPDAAPGLRVGPYRLLRELGVGGMGTVWLAERADGQFDRQVALKMPNQSWMPGLAARMARERRIGALLEHPNIARLYDAGIDAEGRSFITMEYVDGLAIDAWCEAHACTLAQRLKLFVQVVRAVAYAHGRLVVHRDLKPANVLVDRSGQVRLLDFGIAKLVEDNVSGPSLTQELGRLMTRRYASPEQIAGQPVGVATDIYSLGVTLFELLTGAQPYRPTRETPAALEEAILLGQLPLASSRAADTRRGRALRGDVDAILSKALALEPSSRYPNADSMADDIERHLAGDRVAARPAGWLYGLRRFTWQHRSALLLTTALLTAAAVGGGSTWLQSRRAAEQADRARVVTAFVSDLFRVHVDGSLKAVAAVAGESPRSGGNPVAELIEARFADRPELRAQLYGAVARVYADMGVGEPAAAFAHLHLQWLVRTGAGDASKADALLLLARANTLQRRFAQARDHARAAVALLPDDRSEQGLEARGVLAGILLPDGEQAEVRALIAAVDASVPLARRPPSMALARMTEVQGTLLEIENRFDDAVAHWQRAMAMATAIEGPASNRGNAIRLRLALEQLARNRVGDARRNMAAYTGGLAQGGFAGRIQAALATSRFAEVGVAAGRIAPHEASAAHDAARRVVAEAGPALPPRVLATVELRQGSLALQRGDVQTARELLLRAVPVAQAGSDGLIDSRGFASQLGLLAMARGEHAEAAVHLQRRRDLRVRSGDGLTPFASTDWVLLAHNELMRDNAAAARAWLAQAPDFAAASGDHHAQGLEYQHAIAEQHARIALHEGRAAAALDALPADYGALPFADVSLPTLAPYALRGEVLCATGQRAAGLAILQASISELGNAQSPLSPALARLRAAAGLCWLQHGDRAAAHQLAAQARAAFAGQPGVSAWYRRPLMQLDAALAAAGTRRAARP